MLEKGEIISIEDKEYIFVDSAKEKEDTYIFLISNSKPLEVKIAKQLEIDNENVKFELINNKSEREKVLKLFKKKNYN